MRTAKKWTGLAFAPDRPDGEKDSRFDNPANWEPQGAPEDKDVLEFRTFGVNRMTGRGRMMSLEMLYDCVLDRRGFLPKRRAEVL